MITFLKILLDALFIIILLSTISYIGILPKQEIKLRGIAAFFILSYVLNFVFINYFLWFVN